MNREMILRRALATVAGRFDVVLLDCPPSLSLLTVNALGAANAVLIPTQPQAIDLRGLASFMQTLDTIKAELTPGLEIIGVVATFYDDRINTHKGRCSRNAGGRAGRCWMSRSGDPYAWQKLPGQPKPFIHLNRITPRRSIIGIYRRRFING